jgi:peptidoglycan hydrolase CwlO-like protein
VWEGDGRLRFYDPATGEWLRNFEETRAELVAERTAREVAEAMQETTQAQLEAAEAMQETTQAQLETEQAAREAAEARAAALEAELRRLRGDGA